MNLSTRLKEFIKTHPLLAGSLLAIVSLTLIKVYFVDKVYVIEDEAYYFFWSKHLAWGYPEHPPLIAWTIAFFHQLFSHLLESKAYGIRMGGIFLSALTSITLYLWGKDLKDKTTGLIAVLLFQTTPFLVGVSFINLPDTYLVIFSFITAFFYHRGFFHHPKYFLIAGLTLGLAIMAKLPALHLSLAVFIYAVLAYFLKNKNYFKSPYFYFSGIITFIVILPYILWNIEFDLPALFNLNRHLGRATRWDLFTGFWIQQAFLYLPISIPTICFIFTAIVTPLKKRRFSTESLKKNSEMLYLITLSAIPLTYFFYKSIFIPLRINWLSGSLVGLLMIASLIIRKVWNQLSVRMMLFTYSIVITLIFYSLFSVLTDTPIERIRRTNEVNDSSNSVSPSISVKILSNIYPDYEYYLKSYLDYYFFSTTFYDYYHNNTKLDLSLPIVGKGYQIPSMINYYVAPQVESFGWEDRKTYHWMTYYFNHKRMKYQAALKHNYYFLSKSANPDLISLGFSEKQTIQLIETFNTYPQKPKVSKTYYLFLISHHPLDEATTD